MRDTAASDLMGTILLLGITTTLIAGVAFTLQQEVERDEEPPVADVTVSGDTGTIVLAHVGHDALLTEDILVLVENATGQQLLPPGTTLASFTTDARFELGSTARIVCATWCGGALASGEPVTVSLRSLSHARAIVAAGTFVPQLPGVAPTLPTIVSTLPAEGDGIERGALMHLRALVSVRSRADAQSVTVDLRELGGPEAVRLYDDGTNGDTVAGDLTFERSYVVPTGEAGTAALTFTLVTPSELATAIVNVSVAAAGYEADWLQTTIADDAPWPRVAAPLTPVFVNGTNLHLVDSAVFRRADGASVPALWMLMQTRPIGLQLQLLAPANPTSANETYHIVLTTPYVTAEAPHPLVVVPQELSSEYPPASLPPPISVESNTSIVLSMPAIHAVTGYNATGAPTTGTATTSFAHVLVEGQNFEHLDSVALVGDGRTIAVAWAPIDGSALQIVTHPGIPPGVYNIVAANAVYVSSGGATLTIPEPPVPTIDAIDNALPPGGAIASAGDEIIVTGQHLALVQRVQLIHGSQVRGLEWWLEGARIHARLPSALSSGAQELRVEAPAGSATAPIEIVPAQPVIHAVTPDIIREYMQVNVTGERLTSVVNVTLRNASLGVHAAMPWVATNSTHLSFFTYPGLAAGTYELVLGAGERSAIATVVVESGLGQPPSQLVLSPTSAYVDQIVTISGLNLHGVSRIVLNQTNASQQVAATWYIESDAIRLIVPPASAPTGPWDVTYHVELTGAFAGRVTVPDLLTVRAPAAPVIEAFTPSTGQPFTQIDISGTHFVNVQMVSLGDIPVYFAVVSPTRILAVTHTGVPPGNWSITVTTATGSATSTAQFHQQPVRLVPVYNTTIIESFGLNLTVVRTSNHDPVENVTVKIRTQPGWSITGVTLKLVNFAFTGNTPTEHALTPVCTGAESYWTAAPTSTIQNYNSLANQLNYVIGVTATNGAETLTFNVVTNDASRNFILPAAQMRDTIYDRGFPANGFGVCGP